MNRMSTIPTHALQPSRRRLLLHLKCLLWCLHQVQTRYDLNLVLYSLDRGLLHTEIRDSNLGDNLQYIIDHLAEEDRRRLSGALRHIGESDACIDIGDKHFEVGHYVQSLRDFGPIAADSYGVITGVTPHFRGLFHVGDGRLMESQFAPSAVRVIFGTYIV